MRGTHTDRYGAVLLLLSWLGLGLLSFPVVLAASARYPVSVLEQQIPILPPRPLSGDYQERTLVDPLFRWDAMYHFPRIVAQGYVPGAATLAFYPLFPLSARVLHMVGMNPYVSLLLVAWIGTLAYLLVFHRLVGLDLPGEDADWAVSLLMVFPMSMILYVPYMESLFLFFAAAALLFARLRLWLVAGLAEMLAALTKQPGILLAIPLAIELLADSSKHRRGLWQTMGSWFSIALIPLAFVSWTIFRVLTFEPTFTFHANLAPTILELLVSSSAGEMVLSRPFAWPWQIIGEAIDLAIKLPFVRLNVLFNLGGYVAVVLLLAGTWRFLRPAYRAYALAVLVLSLLDYSMSVNAVPFPSLFRHAYLAIPVFIGVPRLVRGRFARVIYASLCLVGFLVLLYGYVMKAWIV